MVDMRLCPANKAAHAAHNWSYSPSFGAATLHFYCPGISGLDADIRDGMESTRSLGYDISSGGSEFGDRVLGILNGAASVYRDRNAVYKDNFRAVGRVMEALFPEGRPGLKVAADYDRWHIFELLVVKLTRYAQNYDNPHEDSLLDMLPYEGILGALDQELRESLTEVKKHLPLSTDDERFCDQCAGPYTVEQGGDPQYGGHWDTCPNRPMVHTHQFANVAFDPDCLACQKSRARAEEALEDISGQDDDPEGFVD